MYGGLGSAVAEVVVETHPTRMRMLGVPGVFAPTGSASFLLESFRLDAEGIRDAGTRAGPRVTSWRAATSSRSTRAPRTPRSSLSTTTARGRTGVASGRDHVPSARLGRAGCRCVWRTVVEAIDECLTRGTSRVGGCDRRHQPARIRAGLGPPPDARSAPASSGSAVERRRSAPSCATAARSHDRAEDRPDHRSAVLGEQDSLAARAIPEGHRRAAAATCAPARWTAGCSGI